MPAKWLLRCQYFLFFLIIGPPAVPWIVLDCHYNQVRTINKLYYYHDCCIVWDACSHTRPCKCNRCGLVNSHALCNRRSCAAHQWRFIPIFPVLGFELRSSESNTITTFTCTAVTSKIEKRCGAGGLSLLRVTNTHRLAHITFFFISQVEWDCILVANQQPTYQH